MGKVSLGFKHFFKVIQIVCIFAMVAIEIYDDDPALHHPLPQSIALIFFYAAVLGMMGKTFQELSQSFFKKQQKGAKCLMVFQKISNLLARIVYQIAMVEVVKMAGQQQKDSHFWLALTVSILNILVIGWKFYGFYYRYKGKHASKGESQTYMNLN